MTDKEKEQADELYDMFIRTEEIRAKVDKLKSKLTKEQKVYLSKKALGELKKEAQRLLNDEDTSDMHKIFIEALEENAERIVDNEIKELNKDKS